MPEFASLTFNPYPSPPACISCIVKNLLYSPFHTLMSQQTMVLILQGRKTGKSYEIVVTYVQEDKTVFCLTQSQWWKNLSGGAEVLLRLRGKLVWGFAQPVFQRSLIEQKIAQIIQMDSREAKYFGVGLNNRMQPDPASLKLASRHFILISIRLAGA